MPDRDSALTCLRGIISKKTQEKEKLHQLREELTEEQLEMRFGATERSLTSLLDISSLYGDTIGEAISRNITNLDMEIARLWSLHNELPETLSDNADQALWTLLQ